MTYRTNNNRFAIAVLVIFVFLCLHSVAAHYTYSEVPYDRWFESLTGTTLSSVFGMERNHFDRLVHFSWGLLLTYPVCEVVISTSTIRGFTREWVDSLRVRHREPLGEYEIERLLEKLQQENRKRDG